MKSFIYFRFKLAMLTKVWTQNSGTGVCHRLYLARMPAVSSQSTTQLDKSAFASHWKKDSTMLWSKHVTALLMSLRGKEEYYSVTSVKLWLVISMLMFISCQQNVCAALRRRKRVSFHRHTHTSETQTSHVLSLLCYRRCTTVPVILSLPSDFQINVTSYNFTIHENLPPGTFVGDILVCVKLLLSWLL